uniref:TIR domain-containing adapter molecule 1 n=1 Tax=Semicossyphus pulcher TaxID=241346 RepID=UPI0037E807D9
MSHRGEETQGTGLRDVFDVLVKATPERLLSLTFQLGESPEDNIIHALCLIVLQREAQALDKLQTLRDNHLANHLAEKWQLSGGKVEDFAVHCDHFQELSGESLPALARMFKVLSEHRLCDPLLRNLAYKRAVSCDGQRTSNPEDLEYDQLREEAKAVCGPQFAEWMCSSTDLKSGSYRDPLRSLAEGNTTLKVSVSQGQSEKLQNMPNPLQASSSMPSYPTHLEISIPPTISLQDNRITPETSEESKLNNTVFPISEIKAENAPQISEGPLTSVEASLFGAKKHSLVDTLTAESRKLDSLTDQTPNQTNKPTTEPKCELPAATNILLPKMPVAKEMNKSIMVEEEEETFYAFVIMHAPEDEDMAESMKEKVEKVIGSEGAILSQDFDILGKSTLRSVEDAINNSAFTLLLLTRNFNNPMQEVEADSALINSIHKKHKYNTVIPVMPRENCMPKEDIPLVLATKNKLEENRNFERKLQKAMSPAIIKRQREMWADEQRLKLQKKKQERLKQSNQLQRQLLKESKAAELLEKENFGLLLAQKLLLGHGLPSGQDGEDGRVRWQPNLEQPNIHIENAKYIMIGNDSRMTVSLAEGADQDDSLHREEDDDDQ